MTLVYDSQASQNEPTSVGTHVLVIGIGEYSHLDGGTGRRTQALPGRGQLNAPAAAAQAIATWFIGGSPGNSFNNPDAPVASVNLIVSPQSPFVSPSGSKVLSDEATSDLIALAFRDWLSRLQLNGRNVGVFYYCGHGVQMRNDIIIPSDFGKDEARPWSAAIDIGETISAVRREVAGPLYFFLDTCRDTVPLDESYSPRPLLPLRAPQGTSEGHMLVLQGASPGGLAFAPVDGLPFFTAALLEALTGAAYVHRGESDPAAVTSTSLVDVVPLLMGRLMPQGMPLQVPHAIMHGPDRPFHLQRSANAGSPKSAAATAGPAPAQSAAIEQRQPRPYRVGEAHEFTRTARRDEACLHVDDYADVVAQLFAETRSELCFAIFGPWGRGKTFLADRIGETLTKKSTGSRTIRFSAWQYPTTPEVWVYLYETFADAAFKGSFFVRLPNIARTAIAKNGYWGLLLIYATIALGAVPIFSLLKGVSQVLFHAYLVLGVYGMIFVWTMFSGVKKTKGRLTREYLTPNRHTEKLGLQATIGEDLRYLLEGWIPSKGFDRIFVFGYWLITSGLALAAILRLGGEPRWPEWVRGNFGLNVYAGPGPVAAAVAVVLIVASAIAVMAWLRYGGGPPTRVLLIVDDLDRCRLEHLLSVVESIKLLVEDPAISRKVQVMMLVEEEVLKRAIFDKYGRLAENLPREQLKSSYDADRLMRENCEKLFTAHLRLPQLSAPDVQALVVTFSGFRKALAAERDTLEDIRGTIERKVDAPVSDTVTVKPSKPGRLIPRSVAIRMGIPDHLWIEEPVSAEYRPATPSEMKARQERADRQKEQAKSVLQQIADRLRESDIYLRDEVRQQISHNSVEDKVLADDEVKAILAALIDEGIKLRDHLGPRTVRAFLFRYQLARLILTKLNVPWTPVDLARDLAAKFMISAETKSPLPPSALSPDLVNLARVIEQVS